jgi:hypothetical protein
MEFFINLLRKLRLSKTREMKEEPKTTDVPYEQDSIRETMKKWKDDGTGPIATTWHRGYMGGVHYTNPQRYHEDGPINIPPDDTQ